jgi:hypothetical protein
MTDTELVERVARALWFDFVDQRGYPNGLPTWDEMQAWPTDDRNNRCTDFRSLAQAAIAAANVESLAADVERLTGALEQADHDLLLISEMKTVPVEVKAYVTLTKALVSQALRERKDV